MSGVWWDVPEPMLAGERDAPFDDPDYSFEVKWDGHRMLARVEAHVCRLWSRGGHDVTSTYPEVASALLTNGVRGIFDGEVVCFDAEGRPSLPRLLGRAGRTSPQPWHLTSNPVAYVMFDRLADDAMQSVMHESCDERYERLAHAYHGVADRGFVKGGDRTLIVNQRVDTAGSVVFRFVEERGLEGMVAKRKASRYRPGVRSDDWLKCKPESVRRREAERHVKHRG